MYFWFLEFGWTNFLFFTAGCKFLVAFSDPFVASTFPCMISSWTTYNKETNSRQASTLSLLMRSLLVSSLSVAFSRRSLCNRKAALCVHTVASLWRFWTRTHISCPANCVTPWYFALLPAETNKGRHLFPLCTNIVLHWPFVLVPVPSSAVERCMSVMQSGTQMVKLKAGSKGLVRLFYLDEHRSCIRWKPSRKSEKAKSESAHTPTPTETRTHTVHCTVLQVSTCCRDSVFTVS